MFSKAMLNPPARARIPITLIGGYLGAGKTSLLNHLLTHVQGERIAVLVNDFGALGLDAALVARRDAETVTLTNGCVCCSIADDFGAALDAQIRSPEAPARIVVETSGVAETGKTARYASGWPGARLDGVLTVVDLETVRMQAKNRFVGGLVVRQIEAADLIVANKIDRVEAPARRASMEWLARIAPRAAHVETALGRIPPALVLGLSPHERDHAARPREGRMNRAASADAHEDPGIRAGSEHGDLPLVRLAWRSRERYARSELATALDALPSAVVRFKGLVRLRECPDRPCVLQGVGRRWSLEPAPPHVSAALGAGDTSAIDFLGVGPSTPVRSAIRNALGMLGGGERRSDQDSTGALVP